MIFAELLLGFLYIGCFSFGGAYGAIPLIREVVLFYGWIDEEKLAYMIAVSESTPGPIMVNVATYVGAVKAGVPGAIIAVCAVVLPAFLTVVLLMLLFRKLLNSAAFKTALAGLRACAAGIILATGVYMTVINCIGSVKTAVFDLSAAILTAALALLYFGSRKFIKKGISPVLLICISGIAGVLIYGWK